MTSAIGSITVDCANPKRLQDFWAAVVGYDKDTCMEDWAGIKDPSGSGTYILFMKVPEPKTVKNRVHVDLEHVDPEKEAERLIGLGATKQRTFDKWIVMQDPEGNEFCIVRAAS
jgi:hypothetical protein